MDFKLLIVIVGISIAGTAVEANPLLQSLLTGPVIPGVPCTIREITGMMTNCFIPSATGSNIVNFLRLMASGVCTRELVDCVSVTNTRICVDNLGENIISATCKPFMDRVSDFQFSMLGIPCRVSHFQQFCSQEFVRRGLVSGEEASRLEAGFSIGRP